MRATKRQIEERVNEILDMLLDGAQAFEIVRFVREQQAKKDSKWHVADGEKPLSDSQIRRYVVKAEMVISDSCRASRKRLYRRHLAQRRKLYARAVCQGDVKSALAVIKDEAEL